MLHLVPAAQRPKRGLAGRGADDEKRHGSARARRCQVAEAQRSGRSPVTVSPPSAPRSSPASRAQRLEPSPSHVAAKHWTAPWNWTAKSPRRQVP